MDALHSDTNSIAKRLYGAHFGKYTWNLRWNEISYKTRTISDHVFSAEYMHYIELRFMLWMCVLLICKNMCIACTKFINRQCRRPNHINLCQLRIKCILKEQDIGPGEKGHLCVHFRRLHRLHQ